MATESSSKLFLCSFESTNIQMGISMASKITLQEAVFILTLVVNKQRPLDLVAQEICMQRQQPKSLDSKVVVET